MKPWKTSFATNETRSAGPSFRLDLQWSGYGPILPQGTSRKPETGPGPAKQPDRWGPGESVKSNQRMSFPEA